MLGSRYRGACLLALPLCLGGCFRFDFDPDVEGCGTPITAGSVAMALEDRYALGSHTKLSLRGLQNPEVISLHPDLVRVSAVENDKVTLQFVGVGSALIRVRENEGSSVARVEVAELEGFEVVTPIPNIPDAGRALIDPSFSVHYFDSRGRLHGMGLAKTTWPRRDYSGTDFFFNDALEPGIHEVTVEVGARQSVVDFDVVAPEDIGVLWLLETDLGDDQIRVDLVGITASGKRVWNMVPYFDVEGDLFLDSFQYRFDPDARPRTVIAESIALSINGPLDPVQKTIRAASVTQARRTHLFAARSESRAPLVAITSLTLIALGLQVRRGVHGP